MIWRRSKRLFQAMTTAIHCTKRKFKEIDLILEELLTNVVCHGFDDETC
ncbi:MAG: hypothetical protein KAH09_06955 [Desulfobacula sp.]|nr:hypothetical protein [Desulfobacula sp.]